MQYFGVLSGQDQSDEYEAYDLSKFPREYLGIDKEQYSDEDYNTTFCENIYGGIRSFNMIYKKVEGATNDDLVEDQLELEYETLFFRMRCDAYNMQKTDLEFYKTDSDLFLIHLRYDYTDEPISGQHFDEENH